MRNQTTIAAFVLTACALLASASADDTANQTPPSRTAVLMRVEDKPSGVALDATIDMENFATNDASLKQLRTTLGAKALVSGSGKNGVILSVIVEKEDGAHLSSEAWMRKIMKAADDSSEFDASGVACFDGTDDMPSGGLTNANYHAFPVAGGWCFDIHASQVSDREEEGYFSKRVFRAMVESFRVGAYHNGSFADHPTEVVDQLHAVLSKHPDWKAAAEGAMAAKPADWIPAFVAWEASSVFRAPAADVTALGDKVVALLEAAKPTDQKACFAWASVGEAQGAALHAAGKFKPAVERLKRALEVAPAASPALRGAVAYALARACAKAGTGREAVAALKTAIECDASRREAAASEVDFTVIKTRPDFKSLLGAPAPKK
ncbi:MAG: tetratricopeptide repeat protein [Planctomycetes bacterium]|nr:tetratricopeptide repeat protein [Planctomycetota bacterium]